MLLRKRGRKDIPLHNCVQYSPKTARNRNINYNYCPCNGPNGVLNQTILTANRRGYAERGEAHTTQANAARNVTRRKTWLTAAAKKKSNESN